MRIPKHASTFGTLLSVRRGDRVERRHHDSAQALAKALNVIGLYINAPRHAVVFSVDEKTAIQALDRRHPVLPLSPGRPERHGFE